MTRIKLCGLSRESDIYEANALRPDYIGFVFWERSRRFVTPEKALELKRLLDPGIQPVGVFVDEDAETVAELLRRGIIDIAQLHGSEDDEYIKKLRTLTDKPLIKAFQISREEDATKACWSAADYILLDAGTGGGVTFDWNWLQNVDRPFFLAGGLDTENVADAVMRMQPFAVDVSSGIETDGVKDPVKMRAFVERVRGADRG